MDKSKLKPFDLQRALAGDPVVTMDGIKVTHIHLFPKCNPSERVVATLEGEDFCRTYNEKGQWNKDAGTLSKHDLFMAPKTREVWVNLYPESAFVHGQFYGYESEEEADKGHDEPSRPWDSNSLRLGNCAHKITIEENVSDSEQKPLYTENYHGECVGTCGTTTDPEKPRMVTKWVVIWKDMLQGAIRTSHQLYDTLESAEELSHHSGHIGSFPVYIPEEKLT